MGKSRIEAFSDGVIAIIITIMVLELKVPHGASFSDLIELDPVFISYVLSFVYVGIYWNKRQYANYPLGLLFSTATKPRALAHGGRKVASVSLGFIFLAALPAASAGVGREDGDIAFHKGEYQEAAIAWFGGALNGDNEQQELLADLLFGPHASAVRHHQYDGIQYLYRAAAGGRPSAMRKLSVLLRTGSSGAKQDADAARCWAAAPTSLQGIRTCMAVTEFQPKSVRVSCRALVVTDRVSARTDDIGEEMSKLCIANKTPALLVPGTPPSARDMRRVREYARHGIEWSITGDVYNGDFERFRESFNNTTVAAIEAERGKGYLERLSKTIENRIGPDRR